MRYAKIMQINQILRRLGGKHQLFSHGKTKADNFNSGLSTNKNDEFSIICLLELICLLLIKKKMPHNNIIKCWQCNFFISGSEKRGLMHCRHRAVSSIQCTRCLQACQAAPHSSLTIYPQTLSQHGDTETGSPTEFQSLNLNLPLVYMRNKPQDISQQDTEMCKLAERSPDT